MMSGGLLKVTVTVCAVLAAIVAAGAAVAGHTAVGIGLAAGLLLGSLNGYVIQSMLGRGTPFAAGSLVRLAVFSTVAIGAAVLLRGIGWSVPLGLGVAQLVMVGAGVRQALRA